MTSRTARANAKRFKPDVIGKSVYAGVRNGRSYLRWDLSNMRKDLGLIEEVTGQVYSCHVHMTGLEMEFVFHGFEDVAFLMGLNGSFADDLESSVLMVCCNRAVRSGFKFYSDLAARGEAALMREFKEGTYTDEDEGEVQ